MHKLWTEVIKYELKKTDKSIIVPAFDEKLWINKLTHRLHN